MVDVETADGVRRCHDKIQVSVMDWCLGSIGSNNNSKGVRTRELQGFFSNGHDQVHWQIDFVKRVFL